MSIPISMLRTIVQYLVQDGARAEVATQGRVRLGEAKFTLEGNTVKCVIAFVGGLDVLSGEKTFLRTPESWSPQGQPLLRFSFDPSKLDTGGKALNRTPNTLSIGVDDATIFFHPHGPDPRAIEFEELEREKKASKYTPAS